MPTSNKVLVVALDGTADYQRLLEGKPQTCGMRSGRVCLAPGGACGRHSTKQHEELLVFLSGEGELQIEQEGLFPVGRGKVAYIPPNTLHDVRNVGKEVLVYIYCVAPTST